MKKKVKKLKYEFENSCGGKKVKGKCSEITLLPQFKLAA
jgi:hypothetical protein